MDSECVSPTEIGRVDPHSSVLCLLGASRGEHSLDETFARADSLASDGKLVEAGRLLAELASTRESRRAAFSAANYLADAGVHATPLA